ncbi:MAG: hypothetical protein IPN71_16340 [Fibrobacteres bacterium]|nr:hypothetical protein [Fibrobacterota bacterium]
MVEGRSSSSPGNRLSAELAFAAGIAPDSVSWKLGVEKNLQEVQDVGAIPSCGGGSLQVEYGPAKGDTLWVEFQDTACVFPPWHGFETGQAILLQLAWKQSNATPWPG